MTNQEIDKRLALAIGYTDDRVRCIFEVEVLNAWSRQDGPTRYEGWQRFDHTDPAVIWPIAERFDCFPAKGESLKDFWFAGQALGREFWKVCAASAVALAVIHHMESIRQGGDV